jgi:hypothetical protein
MEGSVRSFVEECDRMQGLQLLNDTSFFGSFTHRFLQQFHDEHESKISSMVFSVNSNPLSGLGAVTDFDFTDTSRIKAVLNDALCIRHLNEEASLHCFIQSPESWAHGHWDNEINLDFKNMYQSSAIISTHIESATIPLRLRGSTTDMPSFASYLTYGGTMRFSQLSGHLPANIENEGLDVESYIYNLSNSKAAEKAQKMVHYSRWNVFRGLVGATSSAYEKWLSALPLRDPPSTRISAYQMPSSFPLTSFKTAPLALPTSSSRPQKLYTVPVVSSLGTASSSSSLLMTYAHFAEACWSRRKGVEVVSGDADELKELRDELWAMYDLYRGDLGDAEGDEDGAVGEELGEDEEYA